MYKKIKDFFKKGLFLTIGGYSVDFPIGEKWNTPDDLLNNILDIVNGAINLSIVVAVAMIVVGGYTLIMSGGDPDKAEQGQKTLTNSIIGLAIVFVVKLIFLFVIKFFVTNPGLID